MSKYGPQKCPPKKAPRTERYGQQKTPKSRHPGRRGLYGQPESAPGYTDMPGASLPNSGTRK